MPDNMEHEILLFYKYVYIENPLGLMREQERLQARLGIKGRTIIASEGINATLEGTKEATREYLNFFLSDPRFSNTHIKRSPGTGTAFPKLSVKVRPEIVASGFCDIDPNKQTGIHLSPLELHNWIHSGKEFYIVDMRNAYEHKLGYFENSILPAMDNFRDLPQFIEQLAHLKDKTVVTVCTGGVRCEKASAVLLAHGFTDVYQLDGGIVSYMEQYPNEDFVGKLYVFDSRISMGFFTDDPRHKVIATCVVCSKPSERFTNCVNDDCHRQLIACEGCEQNLGKKFLCSQPCKTRVKN
jgi:UPF0176 protein